MGFPNNNREFRVDAPECTQIYMCIFDFRVTKGNYTVLLKTLG